MATEIDVGVNGVARRVGDAYVGVNGVARKITAGYIGVNGVARLCYAPNWFLADGLTKDDVIAAYDFYRAGSQAGALLNQANDNYPLTMVGLATYSQGNGIVVPTTTSSSEGGLWNHGVTSALTTFNSVIIKFKNADITITNSGYQGSGLLSLSATRNIQLFGQGWTAAQQTNHIMFHYASSPSGDYGTYAGYRFTNGLVSEGTLGISNYGSSAALYWNGNPAERAAASMMGEPAAALGRTLGHGSLGSNCYTQNGKTFMAAAFYNVALTAAQMAQIYAQL